MAKINNPAADKENNSALTTTASFIPTISLTTDPVVITAVQRKVNIGNYETVDIYMAVAVPQPNLNMADPEALSAGLAQAAEIGFSITSRETSQRYLRIKDLLKEEKLKEEKLKEEKLKEEKK